jgi:type I restriction enzyme M protein
MKRFRLEESDVVANLKMQIFSILDLFKYQPIDSSDFHFLLFLLSLQKDGILDNLNINNDGSSKEDFSKLIYRSFDDNENVYRHLLDIYQPVINVISETGFQAIIRRLADLNHNDLSNNFAELFDILLYRHSNLYGLKSGERLLPEEISKFMCDLADLQIGSKVYNPFAGLASFGVFIDSGIQYLGQEINVSTSTMASLRLLAYQRESSFRIVQGNSIDNWNPSGNQVLRNPLDLFSGSINKEKYDLVISSPPFGMELEHGHSGITGHIKTYEHYLIDKAIEDTNYKGKIVVSLAVGILFRSGNEVNLRKFLIENDLLEMIISFPSGLLMNTVIPFVVLLINKDKKEKGKVKFVDAKDFIINSSKKDKKLDNDLLILIIKDSQESDAVQIISNEVIADNEFNLNVPRYFQEQFEGAKLGTLGSIYKGEKPAEATKGRVIRIRDLSNDQFDYSLKVDQPETELPKYVRRLDQSCLLLAVRWKTLKPTFFQFNGTPIYINSDILAIKIFDEKVVVGYLINELHAKYVIEQIESIRYGIVVPTLRPHDLLNLKIQLPSPEEQRAKLAGIHESMVKMKLIEAERNALAHGLGDLIYENFASIKHSLGTPLMSIGSSLRNIEKALSKLDQGWKSILLSERHNITLKDSFDSAYSNLDLVHSLLRNNEREFDVNNYDLNEMDFFDFIRQYVKRIRTTGNTNVLITLDIHPDLIKYVGKKLILQSNEKLLDIVFNNVIDNASRHAFVDTTKKYKLNLSISLDLASEKSNFKEVTSNFESSLKIEIANNGLPFPENYTLEKFIRKNSFAGPTGHTGIGGYDINEIIKYLNNGESTFDLITTDFSTEFVTTYIFSLPIFNN